jgi:hypothetical protein
MPKSQNPLPPKLSTTNNHITLPMLSPTTKLVSNLNTGNSSNNRKTEMSGSHRQPMNSEN